MIEKFSNSNVKNKRFKITMDNGKSYNFGYSLGQTYIDHHNKNLRLRYWARHYANDKERELIDNLVPSPALFSAMILWGKYENAHDNISYLNDLWEYKHTHRGYIYHPDFL